MVEILSTKVKKLEKIAPRCGKHLINNSNQDYFMECKENYKYKKQLDYVEKIVVVEEVDLGN